MSDELCESSGSTSSKDDGTAPDRARDDRDLGDGRSRPTIGQALTGAREVEVPTELDTGPLEARVGHRFSNRDHLYHALTHRSFANELSREFPDNESMEFLGDAVLGLAVSDMLYRRFPELTEGEMSKIKSYVVSTRTLARAADGLGLGDYLLLGRGEEKSEGREKDSLLANTFEAVIAALYLDAGLDRAKAFIDETLGDTLVDAVEADTALRDFKSALQEKLQAEGRPLPIYEVVEERGPDHDKVFVVDVSVAGRLVARGEGKTKKAAEQSAARKALKRTLQ